MYERDAGTGTVGWNPEHPDVAAKAMADHPNIPLDDPADVKAEAPIQLDDQTVTEVNARYRELIEANPDIQTE